MGTTLSRYWRASPFRRIITTEIMSEAHQSPERESRLDTADWKKIVAKYQNPSAPRAAWQIVNTLGPYALLWFLMYHTLAVSWWLTLPLAILAGAFLVR